MSLIHINFYLLDISFGLIYSYYVFRRIEFSINRYLRILLQDYKIKNIWILIAQLSYSRK